MEAWEKRLLGLRCANSPLLSMSLIMEASLEETLLLCTYNEPANMAREALFEATLSLLF